MTESVLAEDMKLAQQRLQQIRDLGVVLALDGFGTGYSSLRYLQTLSAGIGRASNNGGSRWHRGPVWYRG